MAQLQPGKPSAEHPITTTSKPEEESPPGKIEEKGPENKISPEEYEDIMKALEGMHLRAGELVGKALGLVKLPYRDTPEKRMQRKEVRKGLSLDRASAGWLEKIETACRRSGHPDAQDVASLFISLREESGNSISPQFVLQYLDLAPNDSGAKVAALDLLASKQDVQMSREFIDQFLKDEDAEVRAAALRLVANHDEIPFSAEELEPYKSTSAAALQVLARRKDIPLPDKIMDTISTIRAAIASFNFAADSSDRQSIPRTMEFDQAVHELIAKRNPPGSLNYLRIDASLTGPSSAGALETLLHSDDLLREYTIAELIQDRALSIGGGRSEFEMRIGNDDRFGELLIKKLSMEGKTSLSQDQLREIKMPLLNLLTDFRSAYPIRWSRLEMGHPEALMALAGLAAKEIYDARTDLIESGYPVFAPGMKMCGVCHAEWKFSRGALERVAERFGMELTTFVKGAQDKATQAVRKQRVLTTAREFAADPETDSVLYFMAHGGPQHVWMVQGRIGEERSNDLNHPDGISYRELAAALIAGQLDYWDEGEEAEGSPAAKEIDLSHMRIILDACIQHDNANNLRNEIFRAAEEQGLTVKGLPFVVSASQRDMVSYGNLVFHESLLMTALEQTSPQQGKPFTVGDLVQTDKFLNEKLQRVSQDEIYEFGQLRMGQDLGLFSPRVREGGELFEDLLTQLQEAGVEKPSRRLEELDRMERYLRLRNLGRRLEGAEEVDEDGSYGPGANGEPRTDPPPRNEPEKKYFRSLEIGKRDYSDGIEPV